MPSPPGRRARAPGATPPLCCNLGKPPLPLCCNGSGGPSSSQPLTAPLVSALQTPANLDLLTWSRLMHPPHRPTLLPACQGKQWSRPLGPPAYATQLVTYMVASMMLPSGQRLRQPAQQWVTGVQPWWDTSAYATVRAWLLVIAGDVELNPGPFQKQGQPRRSKHTRRMRSSRAPADSGSVTPAAEEVLGVTDAVARRILAEVASFADQQMLPSGSRSDVHAWNRPAMRELAARVDEMLGPVLAGLGGLSRAELPHMQPCPTYAQCKKGYHPVGSELDAALVAESDPDGNCFFNSVLLSTLGSQRSGRDSLRLRCLLEFVQHSEAYHGARATTERDSTRLDFAVYCFQRMAQRGAYQGLEAAPIAATVLQCPVMVYCPGFHGEQTDRGRVANWETTYAPPLFVQHGYLPKPPATVTWTRAGGGRSARVDNFHANHFQPMFFATAEQASALAAAGHPLSPPAFFDTRDPARRWRHMGT